MGVPTSQADFDQSVEQIKPEAQKVQNKVDECRSTVDSVEWPSGWERLQQGLLTVVFPIAGLYFGWKDLERILISQPEVRETLQRAADGVGEILYEVGQLLSPGNPFAMKAMADNWDAINSILTGAVGGLGDDKFYATSSWTDGMGQYYSQVPAGQRAALEGLVPHVENMRTYLRGHSTNIIQLWWDLYEEIADFVIEALPLAAKFITGNPIKWLEMAEPIAECIALVLSTIKDIVRTIFDFGMTSNGDLETFRAAASNVTGTDFGKWPVARLS